MNVVVHGTLALTFAMVATAACSSSSDSSGSGAGAGGGAGSSNAGACKVTFSDPSGAAGDTSSYEPTPAYRQCLATPAGMSFNLAGIDDTDPKLHFSRTVNIQSSAPAATGGFDEFSVTYIDLPSFSAAASSAHVDVDALDTGSVTFRLSPTKLAAKSGSGTVIVAAECTCHRGGNLDPDGGSGDGWGCQDLGNNCECVKPSSSGYPSACNAAFPCCWSTAATSCACDESEDGVCNQLHGAKRVSACPLP